MGESIEREEVTPDVEGPDVKTVLHNHADVALGFLETHEVVSFTREEEKAVIRKIDRVLMPLVGLPAISRNAQSITN